MDDERRARLIAWFQGPPFKGDRAKFIERSKYTKGRVTQLFDPKEPFGEKAAREVERRLALPPRFLDAAVQATSPPSVSTPPQPGTGAKVDFSARHVSESEWALLDDIKALPDEERDKLVLQVHERAAVYKTYREQVIREIAAKASGRQGADDISAGYNAAKTPSKAKKERS